MSNKVLFVGVLNLPSSGKAIAELIKAAMMQMFGLTGVDYAHASEEKQCDQIWDNAKLIAKNQLLLNAQTGTNSIKSMFTELVAKKNVELSSMVQKLTTEVARLKQDKIALISSVVSSDASQQDQHSEQSDLLEAESVEADEIPSSVLKFLNEAIETVPSVETKLSADPSEENGLLVSIQENWTDISSVNKDPAAQFKIDSSASNSESRIRKWTETQKDVSAKRLKLIHESPNCSSQKQTFKKCILEPIRYSKGSFGVTNLMDWDLIMSSETLDKNNNECVYHLKMAKIMKEAKDKGVCNLSSVEIRDKLQSTRVLPTVCVANLCNRCNQRFCYYIHGIIVVNYDKIPKESLDMICDNDLRDHLHELRCVPVGCVAIRINDEWVFSQKKRNRYWFTFEVKDNKVVLDRWYDLELGGRINGYPEGAGNPTLGCKRARDIVCRYRSSKKELGCSYIITNHLIQVPKGSDEAY